MELQEKSVHVGHHPLRSTSDGLPNLVGATCVAPAMRIWMHGILPCLISKSSLHEQLYQIRPSAMRPDATIFIAIRFDFFAACKSSALVACHAPSNRPMPLFTSDLLIAVALHHCRLIPTSGEGILAILEHRTYTCSTNNPSTRQHGLCRI